MSCDDLHHATFSTVDEHLTHCATQPCMIRFSYMIHNTRHKIHKIQVHMHISSLFCHPIHIITMIYLHGLGGSDEIKALACLSPCLPVSLSPCLPVSLSPCLSVDNCILIFLIANLNSDTQTLCKTKNYVVSICITPLQHHFDMSYTYYKFNKQMYRTWHALSNVFFKYFFCISLSQSCTT